MSFRSPQLRAGMRCAVALCALGSAALASAQQVAFVPQAEASGEWATNRSLTIPASPNSENFWTTLGGDVLRRTDISSIDLRPLITFQHDDQISALDRFEALVDLASDYRTLRSEFTLNAQYHREDAYNAQYGLLTFNSLNPNVPDTAGTGAIVTGITRTSYDVAPEYSYDLSARLSLVASAELEAVRYSNDIPGQLVSYNSPEVDLGLAWALSARSRLGVSPYFAYYDPVNSGDGSGKNDAYGVSVDYNTKFSAVSQSRINVRVEHDYSPAAFGTPSSSQISWSFSWVGSYKLLTSNSQYSIGRFLEPSSGGGRSSLDQLRVQYNKMLTPRWSLGGAVRLTRTNDIGIIAVDQSGDRDRANAQAVVSYLMTPEWSLSGGYRYAYLKFASETTSAHSNAIFLTVAYHGLQPPRD
ncbi:MAG: hypothetical protein ACRD3Q_18495 [Terriglobales bacterium]